MKKIFMCIAMCLAIFLFQNTAFAAQTLKMSYDGKTVNYRGTAYTININDKEVKTDFPGIDFNKVTMFPLRAVFEQLGGKVVWTSKTQVMDITYNGINIQFKNNSNYATVNGKKIKLSAPAKKINDRLIVPVDFLKKVDGLTASLDKKKNSINIKAIYSLKNISTKTIDGKDVISLEINKSDKDFDVIRLSNPNRIIVSFKNVESYNKEKTINVNLSLVNTIRISNGEENSTRVVLEMEEANNVSVDKITGGYKITVEKPLNAEFEYINNQDRVFFALKKIKLAEVGETITKHFTEEYDTENNRYIMTIPSDSAISLAENKFNINDDFIDYIEITREKETNDTKLVFSTKKEFRFFTSYNEKYDRTEINLLSPAKDDEILVVIDAGHGGKDPGAASGDTFEKDLNLDIALRLEKLLNKKNIRTFMLREDDTFVSLYDRPYIANELNATLFLSIHNNAIDNKNISGTETLYFPEAVGDNSFTGQKFAQVIQNTLISKIQTVNRKTVSRPNLVVLKYTKMPSSLVEVGFLTNATDLKNLKTGTFRQKVALALQDGILESLEKILSLKEKNNGPETKTDDGNITTESK